MDMPSSSSEAGPSVSLASNEDADGCISNVTGKVPMDKNHLGLNFDNITTMTRFDHCSSQELFSMESIGIDMDGAERNLGRNLISSSFLNQYNSAVSLANQHQHIYYFLFHNTSKSPFQLDPDSYFLDFDGRRWPTNTTCAYMKISLSPKRRAALIDAADSLFEGVPGASLKHKAIMDALLLPTLSCQDLLTMTCESIMYIHFSVKDIIDTLGDEDLDVFEKALNVEDRNYGFLGRIRFFLRSVLYNSFSSFIHQVLPVIATEMRISLSSTSSSFLPPDSLSKRYTDMINCVGHDDERRLLCHKYKFWIEMSAHFGGCGHHISTYFDLALLLDVGRYNLELRAFSTETHLKIPLPLPIMSQSILTLRRPHTRFLDEEASHHLPCLRFRSSEFKKSSTHRCGSYCVQNYSNLLWLPYNSHILDAIRSVTHTRYEFEYIGFTFAQVHGQSLRPTPPINQSIQLAYGILVVPKFGPISTRDLAGRKVGTIGRKVVVLFEEGHVVVYFKNARNYFLNVLYLVRPSIFFNTEVRETIIDRDRLVGLPALNLLLRGDCSLELARFAIAALTYGAISLKDTVKTGICGILGKPNGQYEFSEAVHPSVLAAFPVCMDSEERLFILHNEKLFRLEVVGMAWRAHAHGQEPSFLPLASSSRSSRDIKGYGQLLTALPLKEVVPNQESTVQNLPLRIVS